MSKITFAIQIGCVHRVILSCFFISFFTEIIKGVINTFAHKFYITITYNIFKPLLVPDIAEEPAYVFDNKMLLKLIIKHLLLVFCK